MTTVGVTLPVLGVRIEVRFDECGCGQCECNDCHTTLNYYVNGRRTYSSEVMNLIAIDKAGRTG